MTDAYIKWYLRILPIYSLIGIILSVYRTAYAEAYTSYALVSYGIMDLILVLLGARYLFKPLTIGVFLLLMVSFAIGFLNNDFSRNFFTDFTNPLFFFSKILILEKYWRDTNFDSFKKYYISVSFYGSLILLPVTYFLFLSAGATRLAIFPPMEMPFSSFLYNNNLVLVLVSIIAILLYGKRAQLLSAVLVFVSFTFYFNPRNIFKYLFVMLISSIVLWQLFEQFSENLAVRRLTYTLEMIEQRDDDKASAGRFAEMEAVMKEMKTWDYIIGKGLGFKYTTIKGGEVKEVTNVHFSPLGFLSKYGLLFTVFIYVFLLRILFPRRKKTNHEANYQVALMTSLFIFFESFFSYAIFVIPIFPVCLSYLRKERSNKKSA